MPLPELTADALDDEGRAYPRPQLRRESWLSLNGEWEFAIDAGLILLSSVVLMLLVPEPSA